MFVRPSEFTLPLSVVLFCRSQSRAPHAHSVSLPLLPGLIYHPHLTPSTTLPATLLEASARLHARLPPSLRLSTHLAPKPSSLSASPSATPSDLPPALASLAALLSIPPIHVDAVAEAVCQAVEREGVRGVLGVEEMRRMLGFEEL